MPKSVPKKISWPDIKQLKTYPVANLFYVLFFFAPLLVVPFTSELFEFNKSIFVYIISCLILIAWVLESIQNRKIIFRRTILDKFLILFLATQLISTLISIDRFTSVFGYYSRFNGGLISSLSYALLYWAYVSHLDRRQSLKIVRLAIASGVLVSGYALAQHFGIDKNLWVQDVQNRVFATLGQPNWLAAFIGTVLPLVWFLSIKAKFQNNQKAFWLQISVSSIFFLALLFTKSRSGIIGLVISSFVFWFLGRMHAPKEKKGLLVKTALINNFIYILLIGFVGTPWTPKLGDLAGFSHPLQISEENSTLNIESGGTESGEIRKIVWRGAINIWREYPIFGSGVETFAYSYFRFKPIEHNLVSEWDFLYNKAHNEYLNFLATTGIVGLGSYLLLTIFAAIQIFRPYKIGIDINRNSSLKSTGSKNFDLSADDFIFKCALLSGFLVILVTNFFGFATVNISLLYIIFPAIAVSLDKQDKLSVKLSLPVFKYLLGAVILGLFILVVFFIRFWIADIFYNSGRNFNRQQNFSQARISLEKAIGYFSYAPVYYEERAKTYSGLALNAYLAADAKKAEAYAEESLKTIARAISLSPNNVNFRKSKAGLLLQLAQLDSDLYLLAAETLETSLVLAPNDPKIYYNLGLIYGKLGDSNKAVEIFQKTIDLKTNYRDARLALGLIYIRLGEKQNAAEQFKFILKNINSKDSDAQNQLNELGL